MRLWSLHPHHLDQKGLVACWREGLLAHHVLRGKTRGYINHPQLLRFKKQQEPLISLESYLHGICDEADIRGYNFDRNKLGKNISVSPILLNHDQLMYELEHLKNKMQIRSKKELYRLDGDVRSHPIFHVIEGEIESWEKI